MCKTIFCKTMKKSRQSFSLRYQVTKSRFFSEVTLYRLVDEYQGLGDIECLSSIL
jgi:hypothetical protein